jgi:hypothetical protein
MLKLVLVLIDIVRLFILLCLTTFLRLWILLFYASFVVAQLQINFEIQKNNDLRVEDVEFKEAIQTVSGLEPVVNTDMVVTRLEYMRGVCQPGYFWNSTFGTCDLCKCDYSLSTVNALWFEPL